VHWDFFINIKLYKTVIWQICSIDAISTKYLTKHGKICQVLKRKGLILKGLGLFSCLNITKYN
ncbi:hypothetical protein, partial [Acinetobacter baumannii]|uniref:hypothetical protein n=1 Tax=Acinetobacter baumannii TaxID=470 RepID=UPI001BB46D68